MRADRLCSSSPNSPPLPPPTSGYETYSIVIKDISSGELLKDSIAEADAHVVWGADERTLYYAKLDATHRPYALWRHTLGTDVEQVTPPLRPWRCSLGLGIAVGAPSGEASLERVPEVFELGLQGRLSYAR